MEKKVDRIDQSVTGLKKNVTVLKKDVTILKKDVTILKKDVKDLKKGQKQLQKDVRQNTYDHHEFVDFVKENVATKEDLQEFATKEDLAREVDRLEEKLATKEEMNAGFDRIMNVLDHIVKNQKISLAEHAAFIARFERIERHVGLR